MCVCVIRFDLIAFCVEDLSTSDLIVVCMEALLSLDPYACGFSLT